MLTTTVYSTLVYIMAGLNTDGFQYGYFVLVMVLCNLVALSFCQVRQNPGARTYNNLEYRTDRLPVTSTALMHRAHAASGRV